MAHLRLPKSVASLQARSNKRGHPGLALEPETVKTLGLGVVLADRRLRHTQFAGELRRFYRPGLPRSLSFLYPPLLLRSSSFSHREPGRDSCGASLLPDHFEA